MTDGEVLEIVQAMRAFNTDTPDVEAKASRSDLPKSVRDTLSSFSNTAGGGTLLLGVDEESGFTICGVDDVRKVQADLASLCTQEMEPPVRPLMKLHELEGKNVIVAEIPEMTPDQKPCHYKGLGLNNSSYLRSGDGDVKMTSYEVQMMIASRGRPKEDLAPVPGLGVEALDAELVADLAGRLRADAPDVYGTMSDPELLHMENVLVMHDGQPTVSLGGLLALGERPQSRVPNLNVTLVSYPTVTRGELDEQGRRFTDEAKFVGPIPRVVPQVLKRLRLNMTKGAFGGGTFDHWEYPEDALREVVVNALVHRDLSPASHGSAVQLELFPDRLEITSPGGLFGNVTLDELGVSGVSSTRNEFLVKVLEDTPAQDTRSPVVQNRGTGLARMLASLRAARMQPATFDERPSRFTVTIPNHGLFGERTLTWLQRFESMELSDAQKTGLALIHSGALLDNQSYRRATGSDSQEARRDLGDLVKDGVLRPEGTKRWTRYLLTDEYFEAPVPAPGSRLVSAPDTRAIREVWDLLSDGAMWRRSQIEESLGISIQAAKYRLAELMKTGQVAINGNPNSPRAAYYRPDLVSTPPLP